MRIKIEVVSPEQVKTTRKEMVARVTEVLTAAGFGVEHKYTGRKVKDQTEDKPVVGDNDHGN